MYFLSHKQKDYKAKFFRGFTLIELLVVIAIIGVLASVVLASLNGARVKARDARRASDIRELRTAFELFYHDNGQYPTSPPSTIVENMTAGTYDITPYIDIPNDPTYTAGNGYRYYSPGGSSANKGYTMLLHLEKNNGAWCHVGIEPGLSTWTNNYPECEF